MSLIKTASVAIALIGAVHAQTSVVTVFFPDVDGALVGSVIASDASQTTLVVACPSSVSSEDCGLPSPVTVTAGPSTFHAELAEMADDVTAVIDCVLDGTTAATCAQTFIGPEFFLDTATEVATTSNTAITTSATTTVLSGTDITFMPITLVDSIDAGAVATTGASGSGSTVSSTRSGTSSGSGTGTSSGSSTASQTGSSTASGASASATGNGASRTDSRALAYSVVGAGLLGLTAFIL